MENPQAQMQQGQQGPAPEQMQQGVPQQGGQDPQIQQIMQLVQQMMQQGVQPVEAAAELLSKQVPPEIVMQVFVQMGMPEQDAQAAIEQAMQGGQQPQNSGEEQMEGQASNPQEEMAEQGAPAPDQGGQPSPAEEIQMKYGGRMPRRLRSYAEGGDNQELQAVMQQVQEMMQNGSDARQVMEQIQAAAQQGQISPDVASSVMEQLSGMQQASNPQGDDSAMAEQSQDPQMMDPNMAAPDAAMGIAKFGGNLKKLMSRAYGGPAVAPGTDSKTYAQDRTSMFVGAVKNNAYKSTLDDEFPSLGGNQMAYGGDLPKAANGIIMKDGKLTIDPTQFKSEAEYKAAVLDWNMDPNNKDMVTGELIKANPWKEPEFKFEPGKQYELDPTTGKPRLVTATKDDGYVRDANGNAIGLKFAPTGQYNQGYGAINPVAYQNPMGNGLWNNIYAGTSPFARMIGGFNMNNAYDPRITGANLPGGMNAEQFLGAVGANGLVPGMAGNVAGQNWRVGEAEKFKEGSIWKGNRRKGVRYQIDWGDAAAMNPGEATSTPPAGTTIQTDVNGNQISVAPKDWRTANTQVPGAVSFDQPAAVTVANQNLVAPGSTDVVNPASEVNQVDQTANTGTDNKSIATVDNSVSKEDAKNLKGVKGDARKQAVAEAYAERYDNPILKDQYTSQFNAADGTTYDRKDYNSDRAYYKDVYPELDNREIRNLSKTYELGEDPWDMTGNSQSVSKVYGSKAELRDAKQVDRQAARQENKNNRQEFVSNVKGLFSGKRYEYGGGVDPAALENAIALINRAFGGRIPRAADGMDLGSEDTDGNGIPDYLQANNLPANPFGNNGTVEQSAGKKLDINWNQVAGAAGDVYMNGATKLTNFANQMHALNPERDAALYSALNRPKNTFATMQQGIYDQWGNAVPNDIGNQNLNSTNSNFNNDRLVYSFGGKVYEIGDEVELDDNELEQLKAVGVKLSRV